MELWSLIWNWISAFRRRPLSVAPLLINENIASLPPAPLKKVVNKERERLRGIVKHRRDVADTIYDILARLEALDLRSNTEHELAGINEARKLENLMGCDFYLVHDVVEQTDALMGGSQWVALHPAGNEKELAEIFWPIDDAVITQKDNGRYFFERLQTIDAKEARGEAQSFVPKMMRLTALHLGANGRWSADSLIAGLMADRWVPLDRKMKREQQRGVLSGYVESGHNDSMKLREEIHRTISMCMSLALTRRYAWHVALGAKQDGPRILLPTNPKGCLAFFKNRERVGMSRRAALRHWVRHHYRDRDDSGLAYVRDHLRGNTEFRWHDLDCEILVSAFDLEKHEQFKQEADQWRSARKHNRVRVRLKQRKPSTPPAISLNGGRPADPI